MKLAVAELTRGFQDFDDISAGEFH